MRKLSFLLSFLLATVLATVALMYLEDRVGQNRIYVQDSWTSASDELGYRSYDGLEKSSLVP